MNSYSSAPSLAGCQSINVGMRRSVSEGFTLVELLVVLTIIFMLAALLLPALAKSKAKGAGLYCMNNNKQLLLAWQSYTHDNADTLLFASADEINVKTRAGTWVNGLMDNDPANPSNYDVEVDIKKSPLWSYAPSVSIWKCPADPSGVRVKNRFLPRVRSMAMSIWAGGFGGKVPEILDPRFRVYLKMSDVIDPGPAGTWLLLDQRHNSINLGNYFTVMDGWPDKPQQYCFIQDIPASYHHRAAGISFMDGHAEIRRWRDSRTINFAGQAGPNQVIPSPHNQDIRGLQERATRRK